MPRQPRLWPRPRPRAQTWWLEESASLSITFQLVDGVKLFGDVSRGKFRPVVPHALRLAVFHSLHELSHPGRFATGRLVSSRFVWPGLAKQVTVWAGQCLACQHGKVTIHVHILPKPIAVPHRCGATHLFTIINRFTRHSQWQTHQPLHAPGNCWINGWHVLACQTSSRLKEVPNSPRACGVLSAAR